jgi:hypothetical protein
MMSGWIFVRSPFPGRCNRGRHTATLPVHATSRPIESPAGHSLATPLAAGTPETLGDVSSPDRLRENRIASRLLVS